MNYIIRRATAKNIDILDRIHTDNMKGYVEKIYPWNPTLFRDLFIAENYQIIEIEQQIVGFIKLVTSETEIYLADIQIKENYRRQGIGTSLIQSILDRAKLDNKKVWLRVINGNPAEKLYRRLGFIVFENSLTHKKMTTI